jgi:hypothetical protein
VTQCDSSVVDRLSDASTRCKLALGHPGAHDDGCITWHIDDATRVKLEALDEKERTALDRVKYELRRAELEPQRYPFVLAAGRAWFVAEEERNGAYEALRR